MTFECDIDENPNDADIRAELSRVVAGPCLTKSPQLAQFLRFVVGETLAGRGNRIKAYTIATDALGRDTRFDPQVDPSVRVEAGRLRRALEQYYANGGRDDPLVIELPRGGYVPVFRPNTPPQGAVARMRHWRRHYVDALRENFRLMLLIAIIAVVVSLSVDVAWMVLPKLFAAAGEVLQQAHRLN